MRIFQISNLEYLKSYGFKTFDCWIDESYDNEQNNSTRMRMIAAEVNRLCSMSKEQLHDWYWSMEEILVWNRNRLLELYRTDKYSQQTIEYLHSRVRNP